MKLFTDTTRSEARQLFAGLAAASTDSVGITRDAYGPGEQAALDVIRTYAVRNHLESRIDGAANLVITLPGADRSLPCLACGSHLDSVPQGGNFDGAAGLVAGLLSLARMRREGFVPAQDIMLYAFRCEESAWFGKPYIGSSALLGRLSREDLKAVHRSGSGTLQEALERVRAEVSSIARSETLLDPRSVAAYLELHIEQGPVLVSSGLPLAVVTGIRGAIRHQRILCKGLAGHSGTVPRELRKDAFLATAELVHTLDALWQKSLENGMDLVFTSGMAGTDATHHAMTRIPDVFSFSFEVRSQRREDLEAFYEIMRTQCAAVETSRGVRFEFDEKRYTAPAAIDQAWSSYLLAKAEQLQLPCISLPSGAGHDAAVFANAGIPTAMIFVRNSNGSHNPDEAMEMEDFLQGVKLLYHTLREPL